ncbi:AMP-binding protein [Sphingorhabdus sp. YGSMI21]|uniref:AMP-binding protein n=1 Tax=Sphingorhabdus sp. YGSMI21 TaxID=2077182 RepID=UPI0013DCD316|nr:AMP-binding protein [Sphingorhabdus sp. YGSMI21]
MPAPEYVQAPFRDVPFAKLDIDVERRPDGSIIMQSLVPLLLREAHLAAYLLKHAEERPDRAWLAQRTGDGKGWRTLSFADAKQQIDGLTEALLLLGLESGASLAILSGNSIEHAVMMMAALQAGLVTVPVSEAYSLMSEDFGRLRHVAEVVEPSIVFVQDGARFSEAIERVGLGHLPVIAVQNVQAGQLDFCALAAIEPSGKVPDAFAAIDPDSIAKIMFTSGSTGAPKGVPLTHGGLVTAAESNLTTMGRLAVGETVRLDWAPWSHVFGGTTLSLSIIDGGTFYIDEGKPVPGLFDQTLRNLADVQPDFFMNVPSAISMLVEAMEADEQLARRILDKMTSLGYGGAALPADIVQRFESLAVKYTGHRIAIVCGYGTTETGPGGGFVYWPTDETGTLGLPHPGFAMKLVPLDGQRYDVRVAGKAVTKGYCNRPDLNAEIFDADGFYRTGDCVHFANPEDPLSGLIFAGRLNEEFKLLNGTFVRVGEVRSKLVDSLAPLVKDVVVCGENRADVRILAWLNVEAAKALDGSAGSDLELLSNSAVVTGEIRRKLTAYNRANPGASQSVRAVRLLSLPPQLDHGEITDKGSINQRAVIEHRFNELEALYALSGDGRTIVI